MRLQETSRVMISCGIQIGSGTKYDSYEKYGLVYISSDNQFSAPTKGMLVESFPEEAGAHTDGKTVDDVFDYKVKFLLECPNKDTDNANRRIAALNALMYDKEADSDIKTFKEWTIYNYRKRVKVAGYPKPIESVSDKDFFRDSRGVVYDMVVIELTLQVKHPNKCDFAI